MINKKIILGIEALMAILILALAIFLLLPTKKTNAPVTEPVLKIDSGIEILSPKPQESISSPLKIIGVVTGNGWTGFEGQVGTVKLLDANGKQLAATFLKATTEWTQLPTHFEANIVFKSLGQGAGFLLFRNENASGDPARDKTVTLPIKFK